MQITAVFCGRQEQTTGSDNTPILLHCNVDERSGRRQDPIGALPQLNLETHVKQTARLTTINPSCVDGFYLARALRMPPSQAAGSALRASRTSIPSNSQKRNLNDLVITRTGKPILRQPGGRSSLGGYTATVFGATGFIGRYIVNRLARRGCQVVVPYREEMAKRHLKLTGDLGRVIFMEWDLRNTQSIEESVRHSDLVFNLVGRRYPTKNFSFADVHIEGTERIVEAVAKYDIDRYVHVSSYNADPNSPSEFFRTKVRAWSALTRTQF